MENRTNILEHALALFAARGYEAVGVQEVCSASGVTKPTLYHYFGSKRGLLETLVRERWTPFLRALREAAGYGGDLPLTMERVARAYFGFARAEGALYRLLLASWFGAPGGEAYQVAAALNEQQQAILEELFRRAASDHGNLRGRHRTVAATFLGTVNTYVGLALNGYVALDEPLVHQAVHQFSHGIYS